METTEKRIDLDAKIDLGIQVEMPSGVEMTDELKARIVKAICEAIRTPECSGWVDEVSDLEWHVVDMGYADPA